MIIDNKSVHKWTTELVLRCLQNGLINVKEARSIFESMGLEIPGTPQTDKIA